MQRLQALRIRLNPTPAQEGALGRIAGSCRFVWNLALEQRQTFWRQHKAQTGFAISWIGQKKELTALKACPEAAFLNDAPSHCLQMALQDLDQAFGRFFRGEAGHPRPRRRGEHDSFRFPDPGQIRLEPRAGRLVLPKFGKTAKDHGALAARFHRPVRGRLLSVTVSREGRHWYASLQLAVKVKRPVLPALTAGDVEAVDRGTAQPFVTSTGEVLGRLVEGPAERKKQRRLQKNLSRTRRGSKRRGKALERLRAHKARMTRRRRDVTHQASARVIRPIRVLVLEDLKIQAMTATARGTAEEPGSRVAQKAGLNRSILDRGWGEFERQAIYKLGWKGGQVLKVPAAHSSQTCAACGHVAAESRASRDLFTCVACGHADDADRNAAVEIRRRGLKLLGLAETRGPHGSALNRTQDQPRPEQSWQPGEPSAQAWWKREEKNDGPHDPAPAGT